MYTKETTQTHTVLPPFKDNTIWYFSTIGSA